GAARLWRSLATVAEVGDAEQLFARSRRRGGADRDPYVGRRRGGTGSGRRRRARDRAGSGRRHLRRRTAALSLGAGLRDRGDRRAARSRQWTAVAGWSAARTAAPFAIGGLDRLDASIACGVRRGRAADAWTFDHRQGEARRSDQSRHGRASRAAVLQGRAPVCGGGDRPAGSVLRIAARCWSDGGGPRIP